MILTYYACEQNWTGYLEGTLLSLNKTTLLVHKIVERNKIWFCHKIWSKQSVTWNDDGTQNKFKFSSFTLSTANEAKCLHVHSFVLEIGLQKTKPSSQGKFI